MRVTFKDLPDVAGELGDLLLAWRNSPEVRTQMLHQHSITEDEHARWLKRVCAGETPALVRVAFWDERPFGAVSLTDVDVVLSCASWGLYIGEPEARGKGLGKALLAHLLFWGFEDLTLYRLYASVLRENQAARSLYEKAGFRDEGCWREHVATENGRQDLMWVGMTAPEWRAGRGKIKGWLTACEQ